MISFKSAFSTASLRQSRLATLLQARSSHIALAALLAFIATSVCLWPASQAAGSKNPTWGRERAQLRAKLRRVLPAQDGIGARTLITTIAGGGFSTNAPVGQAPMVLPTAVARDPLGRGFYVVDEENGTSLLRFVNTGSAPVTLAGTTILPGQINLIAGGGPVLDTPNVHEVDLTLITGLTVDPTGNAVYLTAPLVSSLRAVNVGTEDFRIFNQTIPPGTTKVVYQVGRSDFRGITMNAAREFFYIGVAPTGGLRVVYKLEAAGNGGNGLETIYAGGGTPPFSNGDGGPATQARLTAPMGLALDAQGNLLIAEGGDTRNFPGAVRRVDTSGVIDSLATNLEFPTGIAVDPAGSVFVALGNAQQIVRLGPAGRTIVAGSSTIAACDLENNPTCGDGGPATQAFLNLPGSTQVRSLTLAADANGVYLPDYTFRRVRYVNISGAAINIAGTTIGGGQINTIVGSGQERPYDNVPAINSELAAPTGVAADAAGNLFLTDTGADPVSRLRFINRGATPVTFFAGLPFELTVQPGHIVTLNHQAGQLAGDDRITTAVFAAPQGLAATAQGLYIVDSQYGALVRPPGALNGRRSGHVRFLNTSNQDVIIFPDGGASLVVVPPGQIKDIVGRNDAPGAGSDFAADGPPRQVTLFPTDVLVDAQNNLYIADQGNNRIRRVNGATGFVTSVQTPDGDGLTPLITSGATGIALDAGGRLHIADTRGDRVLRQNIAGGNEFTVIANNTVGINRPRDLVVDAATNVFVTNAGSEQILRIQAPANALGTTSVVAGTGQTGISGDGGPANRARLNLPNPGTSMNDVQVMASIIQLSSGELIFTDTDNNRLRMLVQQSNQAPVLAPMSDITLDEGQTQTVTINATDGNGDPLIITITGAPGFATFNDRGNGTATLQLAPGFNDAGQYTINVGVTDGDATDAKSFTITVRDANRPPSVNVTPLNPTYEATGPGGSVVNLAATAADPDDDALTPEWFDGATQIATGLTAQITLGIGNHLIFLTVTDSKGAQVSSPAQTVVVQDTTPPVITGVPAAIVVAATIDEGAPVNYTMPTATDLVDGNVTVTTSHPAGALFPVGVTTVNFTATDARGNVATASFVVTVTARGGTGSGYTISTYAGNGSSGASGNNGPATAASFRQLNNLSFNGNSLLIVDGQSRTVRIVDAQGLISSFAGNGANANTGDNGPAIFAAFGQPGGAAADAQGNVYISDTNFNRIRRVAADGRISHFAGSSTGRSGVFGDHGPATNARLSRPTALAVDAQGNVYVCDTGNHRVRLINVTTGVITTIAGNGGAGFDSDGVRAHFTSLNNPTGIALDAQGNLYIADRGNRRVRRVDAVSRIISTVAGDGTAGFGGDNGPAIAAQLNNPNDVATDNAGNVLVADQSNHRIRRVAADGVITTIAGLGVVGFSGDGGPALEAQFNSPISLAVAADGSVYVGDNSNLRVRKLTPLGGPPNRHPAITTAFGNQTLTNGQTIDLPLAALDADGDPVTFSLVNAPEFATIINADSAQRTATLRLAPLAGGTFNNVQIRADDGRGGTVLSSQFNIFVNEPTAPAAPLPSRLKATLAPLPTTTRSRPD